VAQQDLIQLHPLNSPLIQHTVAHKMSVTRAILSSATGMKIIMPIV
jgi:hypothetical protein